VQFNGLTVRLCWIWKSGFTSTGNHGCGSGTRDSLSAAKLVQQVQVISLTARSLLCPGRKGM